MQLQKISKNKRGGVDLAITRTNLCLAKALEAAEIFDTWMQVLRRVVEAIWAKLVVLSRLSISNVNHLEAADWAPVVEGSKHLNSFGWY